MTALVAGASSAIGTAIAAGLAADGHDLVLWGRDVGRLDVAATQVRLAGATARVDAFDLRDRAQLDRAATRAADDLRVLVWAAGTFEFGPHDRADLDAIEAVLDTVLTTAARTARLLLPALLAAPAPASLVLIGSGADRTAYPGNAAYVAAKHGLRGLADALHLDVPGRGVRVTLVSPGLVAAGSGLHAPLAREHPQLLLRPEDVAAAVRFAVGFPGPGVVRHLDLEPGTPTAG